MCVCVCVCLSVCVQCVSVCAAHSMLLLYRLKFLVVLIVRIHLCIVHLNKVVEVFH